MAMSLTTAIVLCTWNGARFLPLQWASLLAQSRLPDEIVVRDDASTDSTAALLDALVADARARGVRVRYLRGTQNLGFVANFEMVLRASSADLLLLCDQDDVWRPDKVATQVDQFETRPALALLCGDARRIDEAGKPLPRSLFDVLRVDSGELRRMHAGSGFEVLLRRSLATGATVALRRGLLDDALPVPEGWVHDEWLAIIAAAQGGFDCLEAPLVDYRQHGGNQLGMHDRGAREKWRDLRRPREDMIDRMLARDEKLVQRLQQLAPRVPSIYVDRALERLRHLRVRQRIRGAMWTRVGPVLIETAAGRYRRHGSGWRSALRDLVRRR